jgi:hypothetical protein
MPSQRLGYRNQRGEPTGLCADATSEGGKAVSQINDGGPAFPTPVGVQHNDGILMRDYFAAAALPVAWKVYESWDVNAISKATYQLADAMLKAREAKP